MKGPLFSMLVLCAVACSKKAPPPPDKTLDEVLQQYQAKVEPKLAAIEAVVVAKTPPVTKAELEGRNLEGRISATGVTPNLTIAYAEDLVDLTKPGDVKYPIELATRWVNQCAAALRATPSPTGSRADASTSRRICACSSKRTSSSSSRRTGRS